LIITFLKPSFTFSATPTIFITSSKRSGGKENEDFNLLTTHFTTSFCSSTLEQVGEANKLVHQNKHEAKVGILCLASAPNSGIDDPEFQEKVG